MVAQILGAIALPALADGDEQMALRVERQTRAEVLARAHQRLGDEDHLQVLEPAVAERGARDPGAVAAVALGRIGEIDHLVRGEGGIQRDVQQPALAAGVDRRHARDRLGLEHAVPDDAQAAGALGDQDVAVRQERHAPRMLEPAHHGDQLERRLLGGDRPLLGRARLAAAAGAGDDHRDHQGAEPPTARRLAHALPPRRTDSTGHELGSTAADGQPGTAIRRSDQRCRLAAAALNGG